MNEFGDRATSCNSMYINPVLILTYVAFYILKQNCWNVACLKCKSSSSSKKINLIVFLKLILSLYHSIDQTSKYKTSI